MDTYAATQYMLELKLILMPRFEESVLRSDNVMVLIKLRLAP